VGEEVAQAVACRVRPEVLELSLQGTAGASIQDGESDTAAGPFAL
jgi:hypothetical protein